MIRNVKMQCVPPMVISFSSLLVLEQRLGERCFAWGILTLEVAMISRISFS